MTEYKFTQTELSAASASSTASADYPEPSYNEVVPQYAVPKYGRVASVRCRQCSHFLFSEYFLVNGQKVCATCAEQAKSGESTSSHSSLLGAIAFGAAGALLGMVLYSAFSIYVGPNFGYLVMILGWIVGKAAITGANSVGGIRIQIAAALLAYAAMSLASLPANLYADFTHSESILGTAATLWTSVPVALAAPFVTFRSDSIVGASSLIFPFIGVCVAWSLARVRYQTVAGPFELTA